MRLTDTGITDLKAHGPSQTCNESEEKDTCTLRGVELGSREFGVGSWALCLGGFPVWGVGFGAWDLGCGFWGVGVVRRVMWIGVWGFDCADWSLEFKGYVRLRCEG